MTVPRLAAIGFIFCCSTLAWLVLGGSVVHCTGGTDDALAPEVAEVRRGLASAAFFAFHLLLASSSAATRVSRSLWGRS